MYNILLCITHCWTHMYMYALPNHKRVHQTQKEKRNETRFKCAVFVRCRPLLHLRPKQKYDWKKYERFHSFSWMSDISFRGSIIHTGSGSECQRRTDRQSVRLVKGWVWLFFREISKPASARRIPSILRRPCSQKIPPPPLELTPHPAKPIISPLPWFSSYVARRPSVGVKRRSGGVERDSQRLWLGSGIQCSTPTEFNIPPPQ